MTANRTSTLLTRVLSGVPSDDDIRVLIRRASVINIDAVDRIMEIRSATERSLYLTQVTRHISKHIRLLAASPLFEERALLMFVLPFTHPELVLPLGFDEMRYSLEEVVDPTLSPSIRGVVDELVSEAVSGDKIPIIARFIKSAQYRSPDGIWHDWEGVFDRLIPSEPQDAEGRAVEEWVQMTATNWLQGMIPAVKNSDVSISMPSLWVSNSRGDSLLHSATKSVLGHIHQEAKSLEELHWRTLEEIVAELLRDLGMEVTVTPASHDGGRDVIARGELIPGEPTLLAVEVKHRNVVPVSELRQALWANRHYPALLFVTSGRFSAGVYREKSQGEGRLRLLLKDGYALKQWIDQYVRRNSDKIR